MSSEIIQKIKDQKVVPLFYNDSFEVSKNIIKALYEAGIRVVEYTNRGALALENFKKLKEFSASELPELFLGIGTVKNVDEMNSFAEAKADFIITPVIDEIMVKHSIQNNIFLIPGCFSPSDVNLAYQNNIRLIKVFPADALGKNYVKSIAPVFPEMDFMLTGGINANADDIAEWVTGGTVAVGLGSSLIQKNQTLEELKSSVENLLIQLKSK